MSAPGDRLQVFLGERKLGELERRGPSRYRFGYEPLVVEEEPAKAVVLSASLPVEEELFAPRQAAPFFEGLLPEGGARATISSLLHLSEEDGFGLLAALGRECAGAVSVVAPDASPVPVGGGRLEELRPERLAELVAELPQKPLGVSPESKGTRLSLGGLQHKLALVHRWRGGGGFMGDRFISPREFSLPLEGAASNCLLKPEYGQYEDLVVNERFCMLVAGGVGLRVADADHISVAGTPCLLVARFDRTEDEYRRIHRIHQEDLCQALGVLPAAKYEENGGPSIPQIVDLLRRLRGPFMARDINDFVHATMVNFLLGNSDAHGKNFALLYQPEAGIRLAPLYDIVSTAIYPEVTDRMAMSIGGIDDPRKVEVEAWSRLSEECRFSRGVARLLRKRAKTVLWSAEAHQRIAQEGGWYRPVIDSIVDLCRERVAAVA
jgi:serine/threonine-protein kinase HipA